ncbi:MAG: helix-turn-helix domain-containing protein [Brachybacterium tyrofermentans]|uniref:helix-turn-helix domain-containing protein n=1 Tax=Brachybacterium tyrofermentans TaxID=47848 RepID=UPI001866CC1D|nr:helix-turn-helix domain-containing protein [Brachybacterium tyrofermentans]
MSTKTQTHFTADEAADYLRVSRREIDRCTRTTEPLDYIPSAAVGEKRTKRLFRRVDLDAWIERHMEDAS